MDNQNQASPSAILPVSETKNVIVFNININCPFQMLKLKLKKKKTYKQSGFIVAIEFFHCCL